MNPARMDTVQQPAAVGLPLGCHDFYRFSHPGIAARGLAEHRVPVAVLNACQSAMTDASEASLAWHLVEAGVPAAVLAGGTAVPGGVVAPTVALSEQNSPSMT